MMEVLVLRLEAPLMSFGGPMIDQNGPSRRFPGLSQLTGLLGNALGWEHRDADRLERLQSRLRPLCVEIAGEPAPLTDYQTVDLGQSFMNGTGWTTRGVREDKGGGAATRETHIRLRDYRVDGCVMVFLRLADADQVPTVRHLRAALDFPARPLFLGRKPCLPSLPIACGTVTAATVFDACAQWLGTMAAADHKPGWRRVETGFHDAEWPAGEPGAPLSLEVDRVIDIRDWSNQLHGGERLIERGPLALGAG